VSSGASTRVAGEVVFSFSDLSNNSSAQLAIMAARIKSEFSPPQLPHRRSPLKTRAKKDMQTSADDLAPLPETAHFLAPTIGGSCWPRASCGPRVVTLASHSQHAWEEEGARKKAREGAWPRRHDLPNRPSYHA
jgi:hypothetical protein